ncbi:hypothetical protein M422DRAFT_29796 [Sphaerobolus stellatus SS14]|uniref:P-loop containing nucleoside triphosphate hydrolase protein n=1 Tax=Sphaerobolus stellatus (strain SS14) TaxID=990650 RepID=A0A0C9VT36_SPHS4|nr:hypothetical protein M422DRAFT_29796 [Sphaerobolus stellatus SS14]
MTYILKPVDEHGWFLWAQISISYIVGAIIPITMPRCYTPVDPLNPSKDINPEQTASWFSLFTYTFVDPLIWKAANYEHLPYEELPPLADYDRSEYLVDKSKALLDPFFRKKRTYIFWGLMKLYWSEYARLTIALSAMLLAGFIPPVAMNKILHYLEAGDSDAYFRPWMWVGAFFVAPNIAALADQYYIYIATWTLVRTEAILTQLVFDHSLRIRMKEDVAGGSVPSTPASFRPQSVLGAAEEVYVESAKESVRSGENLVGRINNYVGTDLGNIGEGRDFILIIVGSPLQFGVCAWLLYSLLGWSAALGVGLTAASIPLPGYIAKLGNDVQVERMRKTDARVQSVTEIMSVIRMTKLFGWENKVNKQIAEKRDAELKLLRKRKLLNVMNNNVTFFLPMISMVATFACYTLIQKKPLSAAVVFSSMALFDKLKEGLRHTFHMVPEVIDAKVSLDRINDFLLNTELLDRYASESREDPEVVDPAQNIGTDQIGFRNAIFSWSENTDNIRRQFHLSIEGELFFKRNQLNLVVGATGSGKTSLLMALLAGDETEVGEKGLTLSGGQKARVTLARAVYSDAAILLLDDILAALDVHTSKFIVDSCLKGDLLKDRTVILVTHNIAMVSPIADFIISLSSDGRIASQGTIEEALKKNKELIAEVQESEEIAEKAVEDIDAPNPIQKTTQNGTAEGAKLIIAEEVALGHVSWRSLKFYLSAMGGIGFWTIAVGGILCAEILDCLQSWFLGYWAGQYDDRPAWEVNVAYYLFIYSLILVGLGMLWTSGIIAFLFGSLKASSKVHKVLISSVLGTTLRWLDTVPTGRIIARCTADIRTIDGPIADNLIEVTVLTLILLTRFGSVILFVPIFLVPGVLVFIAGCFCGQFYIRAQLPVKREMSNMKSPVLAHFGAAIAGLTSIRAYGAEEAFRTKSLNRLNDYSRPSRAFYNCNRWISFRIDAIGSTFTAALSWYLIYDKDSRTAGDAGFSLTMAILFAEIILWWIRYLNDFEVECNSLERIEAYTHIDQEPKGTEAGVPPAYWPSSGNLKVENLRARYSVDGPEVLHNITFEVKSGERIGVVGRTGSGKSSLTLSLLRCIPTEGEVYFDGLLSKNVNLDALRSSITIIPQHPELLSGTLRENLDPFEEHSDATLNDALRSAGLFNLQEEHDEAKLTLDSQISGGGGNLSVGQRQILALARAILRRSKLVILDEATSAIDYSTDAIIQSTLRETLKDATLITVAHRLQTIMDSDKILVLDAGSLVEYDSPANLLKQKGGYLKSLVDESGDRETLYAMAEEAVRRR